MSAQWVFVRHGESQANAANTLAGHVDTPLTQRGIQQAKALGAALRHHHFERAISSTLSRAHDTAIEIVAHHNTFVVSSPELRERNMGSWAGQDRTMLKGTAAWEASLISWHGHPPGGESLHQLALRSVAWLAATHTAQPTLLVAHGGVLRVLVGLLDDTPLTSLPRIRVDNCDPFTRTVSTSRWAELLATITANK